MQIERQPSGQAAAFILVIVLVLAVMLYGCGNSGGQILGPQFTVAVLPDTQCYTSNGGGLVPSACGHNPDGSMEMMKAEMNWIVAHQQSRNIKAVIGVGDIVNCAHVATEWANADAAYHILDGSGLTYAAALGNHDYDGICTFGITNRLSANYDQYFGPSRLNSYAWYGTSSYPQGSNANFYVTFEAENQKYVVLVLEFLPRDAALAWAQGVLDAHADTQVILATHAYLMGPGNTRISDSDPQGPAEYGLTADNNGQELWDNFIRKNKNIVAVVCGHTGGSADQMVSRVDPNDSGGLVAQMLSNYQFQQAGGGGYMRLLSFVPSRHLIVVETYSPYLDKQYMDSKNHYTIAYGTQ